MGQRRDLQQRVDHTLPDIGCIWYFQRCRCPHLDQAFTIRKLLPVEARRHKYYRPLQSSMTPFIKYHNDEWRDAVPHGAKPAQVPGKVKECIKYIAFPSLLPPDRVWKEGSDGVVLGGEYTWITGFDHGCEPLGY